MRGLKISAALLASLWLAGGCQQAVAPHLSVLGAQPDFLLVVIVCGSLLASRYGGSLVGFAGGVINGALAGGNMAAYAISRTLTGALTSWFAGLELEGSSLVALAVTMVATMFAQMLLMFMMRLGPHQIGSFLLATITTAIVNGVIAVPVYALLKRVIGPPR